MVAKRKLCKGPCGKDKPLTEFSPNRNSRLTTCRSCISIQNKEKYRTDPAWRARAIWTALLQRIKNANGKNPSYARTELRMTRAEFLAWAVPKYTEWFRDRPDEVPSIDRIETSGHYEISNLRLLPLPDNSRLSPSNRNVHAPEGQAWCSGECQRYYPRSFFSKNRAQPHGLQHHCKTCTSKYSKSKGHYKKKSSPLPHNT